MEEINRFVILARSGRFTVTDLCEQFGISRKTGYKHLERYAGEGLVGLRPRGSEKGVKPNLLILIQQVMDMFGDNMPALRALSFLSAAILVTNASHSPIRL